MNGLKVDKGWAWVVLLAATFAEFILATLLYCSGVMHVALLEKFKEDNAYTSLIGSINSSMLSLVGPFASALINLYGCRVTVILGGFVIFIGYGLSAFATANLNYVLVTYGLIGGFGLGLSVTPVVTSVGFHFRKYYGLSVGILMSGAGIGTLITGPFVQYLLNHYGLDSSFLMLAAFGSHIAVCGALMRPSEVEITNISSKKSVGCNLKNIFHTDILFDKKFSLCNLQFFLWMASFSIIMLHLVNFSVVNGTSRESAALLLTYVGITSIFGRILTGIVLNHGVFDAVTLNFGFNGILGVATLAFPSFASDFKGQIAYALMFGLYGGGLATLCNPLCMEFLDIDKIASGIGAMFFVGGIGYLSGPPITGFIIDKTGSYAGGFYLCGGLFLLAALTTLLTVVVSAPDHKETIDRVDFSISEINSERIRFNSILLPNGLDLSIEVLPMERKESTNDMDEKTPFSVNEETK